MEVEKLINAMGSDLLEPPPQMGEKPAAGPSEERPPEGDGHGTPQPVGLRRYPKPPHLVKRVVLLCVRPEQWPEAARYPLHVTLLPLLLVVVLAGILSGVMATGRAIPVMKNFAAGYDDRHPPMTYHNGKLSAETEDGQNGRYYPKFLYHDTPIVIDPKGNAQAETMSTLYAIIVNDSSLVYKLPWGITKQPLADLTPPSTDPIRIDGVYLKKWMDTYGPGVALVLGITVGFGSILTNLLWAGVMAFLICPVVLLGAYQLMMPKRVAYRLAFAVTIPLVVVGGILEACNVAPAKVVGLDYSPIIWFFAAVALAFWAGMMANHIYQSAHRSRRGT